MLYKYFGFAGDIAIAWSVQFNIYKTIVTLLMSTFENAQFKGTILPFLARYLVQKTHHRLYVFAGPVYLCVISTPRGECKPCNYSRDFIAQTELLRDLHYLHLSEVKYIIFKCFAQKYNIATQTPRCLSMKTRML